MKTIIISSALLFSIFIGLTKAQTNQGNVLIALSSTISLTNSGSDFMSIGYSVTKHENTAFEEPDRGKDKTTRFNFSPTIGYNLVNNLTIGLNLGVGVSKYNYASGYKSRSRSLAAGPFIRYYIPTSKVFPYIELSGLFGTINFRSESENNVSKSRRSIISYSAGFGLATPLSEKVTFDVLTGYNLYITKKQDVKTTIGTVGLKLGFTIFLGSR